MQLPEFLVKAKKVTYASQNPPEEKLEDNSKQLNFQEGDLKYVDKYFGFNPFSGQEVVLKEGKAIWSMNYYGKIISSDLTEKEVYNFLKKALRNITEDKPFRGPDNFKEDDLEYQNSLNGDINNFSGKEIILSNRKEIYCLFYHGGVIN